MKSSNIDTSEIAKFEALVDHWWDPAGTLKSLHDINHLRLDYIQRHGRLEGLRFVDVGCGGGILSEAMARQGAAVTGIDASAAAIDAARQHARQQDAAVSYHVATAELFSTEFPAAFDGVTCMELLEHVPDPASVVAACARLARPGGRIFFATLNRNPKSYLFAIIGAEWVLRLLPLGTHQWRRFVKPPELDRWALAAGLRLQDRLGLHYNPITRRYSVGGNLHVNYMACYERPKGNCA